MYSIYKQIVGELDIIKLIAIIDATMERASNIKKSLLFKDQY